jgi:hypothetical protein
LLWYSDVACILPNAGVPTVAGVPATADICNVAGALPPSAGVSAVSDVLAAASDLAQGKPLALQLFKTRRDLQKLSQLWRLFSFSRFLHFKHSCSALIKNFFPHI